MDDEPQIPEIARADRSLTIEHLRAIPKYATFPDALLEQMLDSIYQLAAIWYYDCANKFNFENPTLPTQQ
jgi:hypothetical protein